MKTAIEPGQIIMGTMRLGAWGAKYTTAQYTEVLNTCLEAGINTFDLADIYGDYTTEADLGKVLAERPELRPNIQLITKCGIKRVCEARPAHQIKSYDSSREHILASVDNSLRELNTDYLDLLLLHRPDYLMDPSEVADTFHELTEAGKVKAFGVSNFSPSQVELLKAKYPIQAHQIQISLLHPLPFQDGSIDQAFRHSMEIQAWSPLGGGSLFRPSAPDSQEGRVIAVLNELQSKYDAQPDQILLAWLFRHPAGIRPVLGTTRMERIQTAVKATQMELTAEDWYALWQASTGKRLA